MTILAAHPPNIEEIRRTLPINSQTLFAWGDTLYNPNGQEIPPDIMVHEEVHQRQQGDTPQLWWMRYLYDPAFRLEQEVEAYGAQYAWVREHMPKAAPEALFDFADTLAGPLYALGIDYQKAETLIRRAARGQ